ncbi:hypothetical protein ACFV90_35860 [Streptomyces sp. NPDC059904]|uniref:hypothetical protein n=1 Tax=Streptomyces sp. NPDC059904 TaxID=3346996 RepID=UPI0036678B28
MPRGLARVALAVARASSFAGTGLLYLFMGAFVVSGFIAAWYITIPLVLAPYLLAAAGRRGELRADQQSAALGFAPEMAQVLHHFQAEQDAPKAHAAAQGKKLRDPAGWPSSSPATPTTTPGCVLWSPASSPSADRGRVLPETPKGAHPVKTEWAPFVRRTPYWLYGP